MNEFPHHYNASASARTEGGIDVVSPGLVAIETAAPAEFGGPGDKWSPETLLVASVADCFILSFKAIALASKFEWLRVDCAVQGTLDRVDKVMKFTAFEIRATLEVGGEADESRGLRLLEKAEQACLISNSLKAGIHLEASITRA